MMILYLNRVGTIPHCISISPTHNDSFVLFLFGILMLIRPTLQCMEGLYLESTGNVQNLFEHQDILCNMIFPVYLETPQDVY